MGNSLKNKAAFAAAGVAVSLAVMSGGTACAQSASNSLSQLTGVTETLSAGDISAMMGKFSITAQLAPYENNGAATLLAETDGGGRFLISLFNCTDAATGSGCSAAATYTAFSNAGYAYDDINQFNSDANVAKAINVSETNVVVFGMQRFFNGGISKDNLSYEVLMFLQDMQTFVEGRSATAAQVSLMIDAPAHSDSRSQKIGSAILSERTEEQERELDRIVASLSGITLQAPLSVDDAPGVFSPRHAVAVAISNTGNVSFKDSD